MIETLALATGAAPWLALLVSGAVRHRVAATARAAVWITGLGALGAVALAITLVSSGPISVVVAAPLLVFHLDGLAMVMLTLVLGLSAVIQSFSLRYLRGDRRQAWFVRSVSLLTASTALMVTAHTVVLFGLAWVASSIALVLLLATYAPEAQAAEGVRKTASRLALGDLALVAAVVLLGVTAGWGVSFADLAPAVSQLPPLVVAGLALLLVLPALARASQVPFHGWLPVTLAAPTPASALMHAGVVNAGAILIIRFMPILGDSPPAMLLIFAAGSATLVGAALLRMTRADVKGRLVYSTMAQMGFMLLTCGVGATAAAVFHLVAHGLYKSALFLSAGSAIQQATRERQWPMALALSRPVTGAALVSAAALAVIVVIGARLLLWPEISAPGVAMLVSVVAAAGVLIAGVLISRLTWGTVFVASLIMAGLAAVYTLALRAFTALLGDPGIPGAAVSPWWILIPGVLLVVVQVLPRFPVGSRYFTGVLYARALSASSPQVLVQRG